MATQLNNLDARIGVLHSVLTKKADQNTVANALNAANGNWAEARASLTNMAPEMLTKLDLAHSLGSWTADNIAVVKTLVDLPGVTSLRELALNFNPEKLAAAIDPKAVPDAAQRLSLATTIHTNLFLNETSAVLQRMAQGAELQIADKTLSSHVATFLANVPAFNIRTTSIYTALQDPQALNGIPVAQHADVVAQMKTLSLVQAISPVPEAVPALMKANLTSGFQVAEIPESTFHSAYAEALGGEEIARQIYTAAVNGRIRHEHALMVMRESSRGSGLAIIDGKQTLEMRMASAQKVADDHGVQLSLESLFGGTDYCECNDCLSVYSPASYFVEALNYLRNNSLGPDPKNPGSPNPGIRANPWDISNTPLEKLFRRRPDLKCLELTCENTFTVLPYIDLVNEVMESFIVHQSAYDNSDTDPSQRQATLDVFNVKDETTGELLAQPQHINYEAYCILKSAVYPFTLPYHQPIDATRIFLNYLGTSRYELLDTYRVAHECAADSATLTPADKDALQTEHNEVLDRAADAEFLGLTQEEYIILTREAFWRKHYFEITQNKSISDADYQSNIGVRHVYEYYGYKNDADMLSTDESATTGQKGLTFVKKQFLKRTGIQYVDLVELLKTRFINPNFPQGKALTILESIRFSYRFLQSLVDTSASDPATRYGKLIDFLQQAENVVPVLEAILHPDPCKQKQKECCDETQDLRQWVYCYFERIGKLIVLDSGEAPRLMVKWHREIPVPLEGNLYTPQNNQVGFLRSDGVIFDATQTTKIGQVNWNLTIQWSDGKSFSDKFGAGTSALFVTNLIEGKNVPLGYVRDSGVWELYERRPTWTGTQQDTCNLESVRLVHLDGSVLTDDEYDRFHRFIRLWRKLGWTIDETEKALTGSIPGAGAAGTGNGASGGTPADSCQFIGFDEFKDDCTVPDGGTDGCCCDGSSSSGNWPCPDPINPGAWNITPSFLRQLAAIRKLLDQTGLPLTKLLTFWSDISTAGEKSLYSALFLTHNLISLDDVFKADKNGNYLTQSATITDHLPVLMAAFKLKADDISAIMQFSPPMADALTLSNVSAIYRYSLLAKLLGVKPAALAGVAELFGNPFLNPQATLDFLKTWGKMEDAGFTFPQLNYLIKDRDDALHPLAPAQKTILQLSKTLYDGLNGIDRDHPDIPDDKKEQATEDLVRNKAGLLFEPPMVEKIIGLLDGTTVYTTNAPAGQTINVPDALAKKLKYVTKKDAVPAVASLQVTGILTDAETIQARALCTSPQAPDWGKAIDRVAKQAKNIFNDALAGIFPDPAGALQQLLAGDVNTSTDPQDVTNTSSAKRVYFLKYFLPFLRQRLAHRLVVDTMSEAASLASDLTDLLLSDLLVVGTPAQAAMDALMGIKDKPVGSPAGWKGYLISPASGDYTFSATGDTQPADVKIDGHAISFAVQQEDPSNVWFTDPASPVKLKAGHLYLIEVSDRTADQLQWKTASSSNAPIPSSALLPDYSSQRTKDVFTELYKSALLVNGFSLDATEVAYWQDHAADFDGFDFNAVTLQYWKRLQAYVDLRNNLPKTGFRLLDLFKWAKNPDAQHTLSAQISAATLWKQENVDKLLTAEHFDMNDVAKFCNEINLVKLSKAVTVAGKIGVDIDRLFDWAKPGSKFWECHQIAESIRKAIRSRFNEDDWEQVVKPLNDQLRENQKQALISYLLVQQDLVDWGVVDADSLFEFFLIDVQMGACMQTSRIKQAISSVQLFVQRCMLGLEADYGVPNDVLDRHRWEWMQKYRVWEANRKVFLYPENWIDPALRDDKSPFYKELESELLQKDINTQTIQDALKNYLFKVDEVAHLQVVGLFLDETANKLHVFGRTQNAPYLFYYRYFNLAESNWYPWEKMQVDIPSYDVADDAFGYVKGSGTYLIPAVWKNRLLVFFPDIVIKTRPASATNTARGTVQGENFSAQDTTPITYSEIKLAWSEYRNGKWTQKQVAKDAIGYDVDASAIPHFSFVPDLHADSIKVNLFYRGWGSFGPGVSSWANGRLDVFARGTDNALWHKWFDGSWSTWESLGGALSSAPAAVSWGNNRIDVFVRGPDNALWHKWWDGTWSGWETLGGVLSSGPAVSSWANGRLDVFARGSDNALWHIWYDGNWSAWETQGGTLTSEPSAVSWGKDRIDVFARGNDNSLVHKWYDGSWHDWENLGGSLTSGPAVSSWAKGRLDVFARGSDNALWHIWYDGNWSAWETQGGTLTSEPSAVSWGKDRIDVFARGTDTALWHKWYDGAWHDWQSIGATTVSCGAFDFIGSQLYSDPAPDTISTGTLPDYFHFFSGSSQIHSLQLVHGGNTPELINSEPFFEANDQTQRQFSVHVAAGSVHNFYHPFVHELLGRAGAEKLDDLFDDFTNLTNMDMGESFGDDFAAKYHELKRAYSVYNWEFGFHAPMQLVDRMLKSQQFDQALKVIHYVLDPSAKGSDVNRFWQFPPFKEIVATKSLEQLFLGLQPNQPDTQNGINEWRDNPFQPHVIARSRPVAYMKYVAMKYIEILIAYGDYYFRQFTLETLPLAIQCYVLASHVYGPRGQKIPKRGKVQSQTYMSLLNKWDAFGNAVVELELAFPFSNQTPLPIGVSNGTVGLANVFGFATTLYFCIPDNPQMKALRDTIDDRLFKIRHCQDINGVYHQLPLFEPPIDPGLLVQAAAQGLSISTVLNDLNSPMPNYRFYYLLQKALELCNEVKSLGNAFLSAKEKGDGEALSRLRAKHETAIQNMVMEVKKLQLDESQKSLDALQQSRLGPVSRMQYYLKLVGEDAGKVPKSDADFSELQNQIETTDGGSGLKLIPYEKEEMDMALASIVTQTSSNAVEALAGILFAVPDIYVNAMPLGVGETTKTGGSSWGSAASSAAKVLQIVSSVLSYQSSSAARKAGFLRQLQDRVQQANAAGYEIKHIDKQILAQQIRINLANQEITNQQQQIDNSKEVEDFLRNKYTNQELYSWMEGQIRTLYYQAYTLAYDLAKRAEKVFRFERGLDTSNFMQFGYWDAGYDGLLAGERLYVGLKQLESAYQEKRGYDFEIATPISLRQLNPLALIQLKETGSCEFSLPEVLFDISRPGDYMRRIKSVALTIPCVVGPYTGLNATLRLLEHTFRTSAVVANADDYAMKTDQEDARFSTVNVPITSIATSTGQNDSGVFELNFRDERYLPFEGAGAISKWRLELPAALRQFDYETITDVIIQMRYTSVDGGSKLQQAASGCVAKYFQDVSNLSREEGLFAVFDLRHDFANAWYKAMQVLPGATERVIVLDGLIDRLPIFTQGRPANKIQATDIYLFTPSALTAGSVTLTTSSGDAAFADSAQVGSLKSFIGQGPVQVSGWQLKVEDVTTQIDRLWMVIRYELVS